MKKHAATLLILLLVALTGLGNAQTITTMIRAQVPFDFIVNGKTMPAGECTIIAENDGTRVLWVASGDERAYVLPTSTQSRDASTETNLVFRKYGDRYFLARINREGSSFGYKLPASKLERELARNNTEKVVALLAFAK